MDNSRYGKRGVSASKSEVHDAIKKMDKGLFPTAFCKILPDLVANDDAYCNIMHADTAGTKTSLAYIYWKETQDLSVWKGVVQDSIVMNIDDMACVGSIDNIILSSTVGRNKSVIPSEVIKEVIGGTSVFIDKMLENDVRLTLAGGETADVGDIVRTIDVGITAFSRLKKSELVINQIRGGDVIVGLASDGIATYESEYNGGMGSNGLTSARHDVFEHIYREKYPESYDPAIDKSLVYCGSRTLTESIEVPGFGQTTIGKLVLSPTRTYIPVIKKVLAKYRARINGLIHCTGGAQTKVMKFVNGVRVVKNNLMPIPPLFQLIESESGTNRKEMYEVFNMGHRLEFYTDEVTAQHIIDISKSFNINAQIIGHVEASQASELIIRDNLGEYTY
jgi:phosphoribosylformylglycinamidine cyclo-ligase